MCDGNVRTHPQDSLAADGVLNKSSLTIGIDHISTSTPTSDVLKGKGKPCNDLERYCSRFKHLWYQVFVCIAFVV